MGMDSYLYKIEKEKNDKYMAAVKKLDLFIDGHSEQLNSINAQVDQFLKELEQKYPALKKSHDRKSLCKVVTQDEINKLDLFIEDAAKLDGHEIMEGIDSTPGELILSWRKAFGLHGLIVRRYCGAAEDNCVRIPIPQFGFVDMVHDMDRCLDGGFLPVASNNPFGQDDYWTMEDLKRTKEAFERILDSYDDDYTFYYYAWY